MSTKLSRYAEGVMEAAWLAAVICVPVFFNIYSSRIFEPDKITLLRTITLVMLAAWGIKLFEEGGVHWGRISPGESPRKFIRIPLVLAVGLLAVAYIISTIFSVTFRTSLLGSYPRLQGTYTTLSYLVVFACLAVNLRRREQVERLIGTAIIASLPVSLYGVLQRYKVDPIPWGGDTSARIASNMGNSIFVAAYLIMVFPLTIMRIVDAFESLVKGGSTSGEIQKERRTYWLDFARSTSYVFIAALQVIAIYLSGSRGPWLGLGASLVFIWLGLSIIWRKRGLTIAGVTISLIVLVFLGLLNIKNGPLESLRTRPEFSRLGSLLDAESRTGKVRTLIWQGTVDLVSPHQPLEYPDGSKDILNFLRPVVGYGPESMYVAYNPFYPPELTQVEKRNASPDRSHNETWDSLVITGLLGLILYLILFGSVLYYGLKWLGLVRDNKQRNLYLALYLIGGVISTTTFVVWQGIEFLGVALPFGMILGVIAYLIYTTLFGKRDEMISPQAKSRAYVLLGLLAAVMAHFVEINFGIAIAATRTYFWIYSALLLLVGYILPLHGEYSLPLKIGEEDGSETIPGLKKIDTQLHNIQDDRGKISSSSRKRRTPDSRRASVRRTSKSKSRLSSQEAPAWLRQALIIGLLVAILLSVLGYEFLTNTSRGISIGKILSNSFFPKVDGSGRSNYGVLALILASWFVGVAMLSSEIFQLQDLVPDFQLQKWGKGIAVALGTSLILALFFWMWHASGLATISKSTASNLEQVLDQVKISEGILTAFYIYLFALIFGLAASLPHSWPSRQSRLDFSSWAVSLGALLTAIILSAYTNVRIIQADIAFKAADLFTNGSSWPVAIAIYDHANELAPSEDYYYLFLGRAYLEYSKTLSDPNEQERLMAKAAADLRKAQDINPLNTDHTANLARLYNLWAAGSSDPSLREQRAITSDNYFAKAVILSPNNAKLWDEWSLLYMNILNQPDQALIRLEKALEIDPYYDFTYGLMGDYYVRFVAPATSDPTAQQSAFELAAQNYAQALELAGPESGSLNYSYALALAGAYVSLNDLNQAIRSYEQALDLAPAGAETWRILETLARLYAQAGDMHTAAVYVQAAINSAPEDQKQRLQELLVEYGGQL